MNASPISSLIARENELSQLSQFLEYACTGKGQVVFVRGTRGSGKTTLLYEFAQYTNRDDVIIATATCRDHFGPTDPYRPFIRILHALIANPNSSSDIVRALVEQGPDLSDLFIASELLLARVPDMASSDPVWYSQLAGRVQQHQVADVETRVQEIELSDQMAHALQIISHKHPIVMMIDDLQWADSASISLLFHLGQELSDHNVLIVGAYNVEDIAAGRDGKPHPLESVLQEWQRDQKIAEINLDNADGRLFVTSYIDTESNNLGQDFRDALYVRTRGHPLFTIELLRDLQERGDLIKNDAGAWIQSPTFQWASLPANAEAVIAERLSRLPEDLQTTLSIASIEGDEFNVETLAQAQETQAITIADHLDALENQFRIVHTIGNGMYQFQHTLFRYLLYQSIEPLSRARLHQAVGQALEKHYLGQNDSTDLAAQLEWHWEQAAQASQAARITLHAGRRANRLSAYDEAMTLFQRGLQWLSVLPQTSERDEKELELRLAFHVPLIAEHGYASTELRQSIERLQEICDQAGEIAVVIPALLHLADFYNLRSELDAATQVAQRALDMAQRMGDPGLIVWAQHSLSFTLLCRGDLATSRQHWEASAALENNLALSSPSVRGIDARVARRVFSGIIFWLLGYPDKAKELIEDAMSIAEISNHPTSLAAAWNLGGALLDVFRQDYKALPERITTVLQLANKYELAFDQASVSIFHGRLLAKLGRVQDGIQMMYRGLAARQAVGLAFYESLYMGLLAETYNAANRPKQAQHALSEAIMSMRETGEQFWEAELYRQVGEALMHSEPQTQPARGLLQSFTARVRRPSWDNIELDELLNLPWDDPRRPSSEYCFERAIEVAQKQQAKMLELRATISLCRLWQRQDKRRQAHQKLSALYKWFSEGFETQDIKDAKALLNALANP